MQLRVKRGREQEPLSQQLKDARATVDLTQAELASRFGVSVRTVQLWEAGGTPRATHRRAIRDFVSFVNCEERA